MTYLGANITINAVVIKENNTSVLAKTKNGYELIISKDDINTICPKIEISKEDKRRGN